MSKFLIVPFDNTIRSSHGLLGDYVIYPVVDSEFKEGEPHTDDFIFTNVVAVRKLPVLA